MNRPIAAALLALALAAPAVATADGDAGKTYDLKTFLVRHLKKGERAHEHSVDNNHTKQTIQKGAQVVRNRDVKAGTEYARIEEIQKVDAKGHPSQILYTYETFKSVRAEKNPDVKGLQVLVAKGADGKWTVTGQGKAKIPPALARDLRHNPSNENDDEGDKAMSDALLPTKPVAIGDTWAPDAKNLVKALKMPRTVLVAGKSSIKGTFQEVPNKAGWVEAKIVAHLAFQTFTGMPTGGNLAMDLTVTFQRPEAASLLQRATMRMTTKGTIQPPGLPPGMSITLDIKNDTTLQRDPVSK